MIGAFCEYLKEKKHFKLQRTGLTGSKESFFSFLNEAIPHPIYICQRQYFIPLYTHFPHLHGLWNSLLAV